VKQNADSANVTDGIATQAAGEAQQGGEPREHSPGRPRACPWAP